MIYKTKTFTRFCRKEGVSDTSLVEAVRRAERGLVDADLGGGIIKQRVARTGQGSRGGYRTLLAFSTGSISVFLFGFAKSERANVGIEELKALQAIGASWLAADSTQIARALEAGLLIEVGDASAG